MLVVDTRWSGPNGIGRYANEVVSRLPMPWVPIDPGGRPSSPIDFISKRIASNSTPPSSVYTPGYNGFLSSIPQSITVLDLIHLQGRASVKYRPYYDLFLRPLIVRNRHVLTISETSKRYIEEWLRNDKVEIVNAGVGVSDAFHRDGAQFEHPRPYVLFVGNFKAHKNAETAFQAMSRTDLDFVVVARDSEAARSLAARSGIDSRMVSISNVNDEELAALYRGARATIVPSIIEGFGLPALEGALCGSPIVYWEGCKSVAEVCGSGGLAVKNSNDASEWADVISSVSEGDRFPSGSISRNQYSWDTVGVKVSDALSRYT